MKKILIIILVILVTIVATSYVIKIRSQSPETFTRDSVVQDEEGLSEEVIAEVIKGLSKHIILNNTEEPVVSVIVDADALIQEQGFYENSNNGDYLIIYPQSARAIVYSLDRDVIINVGPVYFNEDSTGNTVSEDQEGFQTGTGDEQVTEEEPTDS